jgi:anti-sigma factor RsiW
MSALTHAEIEDLLGVYALNALDGDEHELVERHLEGCPRCRAEVAQHREVAATLAATGGPAPEGVWNRIAAVIEGDAPDMPLALPRGDGAVVPLRRSPAPGSFSRRAVAAMAAAAAVVVALLGVGLVRQDQRLDDLQVAMSADALERAAVAAQADPEALVARMESDDGDVHATAAVLPDGKGYLVGRNLPVLDVDRTYQLWGVTPDDVISLGVLGPQVDVAGFAAHGDVKSLVITEEVAGGVVSSEQPPALQGELI